MRNQIKKIFTPIDIVFVIWQILAIAIIAFRRNPIQNVESLYTYHILMIIGCVMIFYSLRNWESKNKLLLLLRYSYAPLFFVLQFSEIELVNHSFFEQWLDPFFMRIDYLIFGCQPSICFWMAFPSDFFSEFMHLAYFMFYPIFFIVILVPFIKKQYEGFLNIVFVLSFSFMLCYLIYFIVPVIGPRIYINEAAAIPHNGFLFSSIMTILYRDVAVQGAAFPSSHCAMAVVNLLLINKYIKSLRIPALFVVFFLVLSTFYCRYHYFIDSLAGVLFGIASFYLSMALLKKLKSLNFKWMYN
jgi:membrane-associated phospholipid phosphatase